MPLRKAVDFFALQRNTAVLLAALVLAGMGERLWLGFVPKYLLVLGAGQFIIGIFDALQTLLGALYAYPGGWLTDRWGQRRSLILFSIISIAGYTVVLAWHHWLALLLGSFLFLAWSTFSLPATFTIVATSLKSAQHTMGIGVQSMVRRIPMMIGPLAGGWLITAYGWERGVQLALLACIFLSLVTIGFQALLAEDRLASGTGLPLNPPELALAARPNFASVVKSFSPALRELLMSDILIRFCERLPYAWVVVWALNNAGITAKQYGVLVACEMITAMLCYIPVAHLADKYGRRPFVLITFGFFTLFPLSLIYATNFRLLLVAFAIRGLKEFGEPARKALIIGEAKPELRARTYGAYYLIRDCVVTTGSFLGAWLWSFGPHYNFLGAAFCGLLGTLWFWLFVFRKKEGRVHR
jgi:MFS family permease